MFDPNYLRTLALYGITGVEVALLVVIFSGGGFLLDKVWEKTPLFTLAGMVLGCLAAGFRLWQAAQRFSKEDEKPR